MFGFQTVPKPKQNGSDFRQCLKTELFGNVTLFRVSEIRTFGFQTLTVYIKKIFFMTPFIVKWSSLVAVQNPNVRTNRTFLAKHGYFEQGFVRISALSEIWSFGFRHSTVLSIYKNVGIHRITIVVRQSEIVLFWDCFAPAPRFEPRNKLRQLGLPYRIVDDLDSKPSEFERQFRSDSKSDIEIGFRLRDHVKIWTFLIEIQLN